jgi:molybdopterin-guanine dinucleotide biosynthesis protein A
MHVRTEHDWPSPLVWPQSRFRLYGLAMAPTAGILLTGGRSRRMGVDKASLVADGETLAVRAGRRLAAVCSPVVEVGDGGSGLPSVRESPPGSGPLAALAAAGTTLRARGHGGSAILLGVDLPAVDQPFLSWLRDRPGAPTAVPQVDGRLQLVCARYGADALLAAESLVVGGIRSLHELLDVVEHDVVGPAEWAAVAGPDALLDVDTPADAERFGLRLPGLA